MTTETKAKIALLAGLPDDQLELFIKCLADEGCGALLASNPAQAQVILNSEPIDIIVVEDLWPRNAIATLFSLGRKARPECRRILVCTNPTADYVIKLVNCALIDRFIPRPISKDSLPDYLIGTPQECSDLDKQVILSSDKIKEKQSLEECLHGEILRLAIQPIVNAQTLEIVAYEGLLRSSHPILDGPMTVFHAAERLNMVHKVSAVVARRAIEVLSRLSGKAKLFLNIHPVEFGDPKSLSLTLAPIRMVAHRVVIEITERHRVTEMLNWRESVGVLTKLGHAIAVDDVGAGYSSLSVLAELEPQYIKVDMSIVRSINTDARKQRLLDLLVRFAEATKATVIAEGVEEQAEADTLKQSGVHLLQGYFFGRPSLELSGKSKVGD